MTFYKSVDQLPPFTDYALKGRTYRYFRGEPLYSFGFGLSYSRFEYSRLKAKRTPTGATIQATVKNTSARDGDEVVQLYIRGGTGEARRVRFMVNSGDLQKSNGEVSVGGRQPLAGIPHVRGTL